MKALAIGLVLAGVLGMAVVGICAQGKAVSQVTPADVADLIQKGPALIAEGNYKQVFDLIKGLPEQERNNIQIRTIECFANLKGWVSAKYPVYKTGWQELRMKLIYVGDNEATPTLVALLKDKDPYVREYAAELLGHIGDEKALDALNEAGKGDENSGVRRYAQWAYKQISSGLTPSAADLPSLAAPAAQAPVAMQVAGPITTGKGISLVNSTSEFKIALLAVVSNRRYYADLQSWGDIIIDQLEIELQKRGVRVIPAAGSAAKRVVIGVLDLEAGEAAKARQGQKKDLMEKLQRKPLVRIVDIPQYSSLSDLQKNGYEKAERYKKDYQLDMILNVSQSASICDISLIDLYRKKVEETSLQTESGSVAELTFEKLCNEVLTSQYLKRVLAAKKKAAGGTEAQTKPQGDYIFTVSVQDAQLVQGAWATRCIVNALVKRGDGRWSNMYTGNSASPASPERAIDGAVYRVIEGIIKDAGFRNALSQ